MLEGVGALGKQAGLVQELGRLEVREAATERRLGQLGNGLQQRQGDLGAIDRSRLEQTLLLGRQPIDAGRQDRLYGGWHLHTRQGLGQVVGAPLAAQYLRLH